MIGVNFIDKSAEPKPEWLKFLSSIKDRAHIIILPTPTGLTGFKQRVEVRVWNFAASNIADVH